MFIILLFDHSKRDCFYNFPLILAICLQEDNPEPAEAVDKTVNAAGLSEEEASSAGYWSAKVHQLSLLQMLAVSVCSQRDHLSHATCMFVGACSLFSPRLVCNDPCNL